MDQKINHEAESNILITEDGNGLRDADMEAASMPQLSVCF